MMRTIVRIWLIVAMLGALGTGMPPAAAGTAPQSASGFGQVHLGLPFRNFALSAMTSSAGTVSGQAQLENRSSGFIGHIQIDCLNVLGSVAVMSGEYTYSNFPDSVGSDVFFAVRDNGEGPNFPPDQITLAFTGLGLTCADITDPALLAPFLFSIEGGQIRVES
jgi:hypothetical protein